MTAFTYTPDPSTRNLRTEHRLGPACADCHHPALPGQRMREEPPAPGQEEPRYRHATRTGCREALTWALAHTGNR